MPVSRWTEVRVEDIPASSGLRILADNEESGLCLLDDPNHRMLHMFNHLEYDTGLLAAEYERDIANGKEILLPRNYFPGDDPQRPPRNSWRSHAHLLFGNWINEIYQTTPFELQEIGQAA